MSRGLQGSADIETYGCTIGKCTISVNGSTPAKTEPDVETENEFMVYRVQKAKHACLSETSHTDHKCSIFLTDLYYIEQNFEAPVHGGPRQRRLLVCYAKTQHCAKLCCDKMGDTGPQGIRGSLLTIMVKATPYLSFTNLVI